MGGRDKDEEKSKPWLKIIACAVVQITLKDDLKLHQSPCSLSSLLTVHLLLMQDNWSALSSIAELSTIWKDHHTTRSTQLYMYAYSICARLVHVLVCRPFLAASV